MTSIEHKKPSIKFIRSFYSGERNLFYRMATSLEIDGDLALKIISFWLWLEENINTNVIHSIESLSDNGLKRISLLGEQVLTNAAKSDSSVAQKALSGVDYFLGTICIKAIHDLKEKKEHEKAKKALQELDLQEFLCKSDPSNVNSHLFSGDRASSSSSVGIGFHTQSKSDFMSRIPEYSSPKSSVYQTGNFSAGEKQKTDCTHNSSQLSAMAKAYIPNHISRATSLPVGIPKIDFTTPLLEHMMKSSKIVPLSAQVGAISQNLSALHMQIGAIVPHIQSFSLQSGAILPQLPPLVQQTNTNIIPHMQLSMPSTDVFSQHMSAFTPQTSAVVPHTPLSPQNGVVYISTLSEQSNMLVQQISTFSPHDGSIVAHVPMIPPQIGTITPSQNGTNMFQTPNATDMIINAQNIPQPAPTLVPPRRLHPDERTLFVTFSNGSPLTEEELLKFFAARYNIDVESIFIEEPNATRTPQYAHVTFFNQESVEYVLNGQAKVKFRTNGKHLWARRFIPRRRRRWGQNIN